MFPSFSHCVILLVGSRPSPLDNDALVRLCRTAVLADRDCAAAERRGGLKHVCIIVGDDDESKKSTSPSISSTIEYNRLGEIMASELSVRYLPCLIQHTLFIWSTRTGHSFSPVNSTTGYIHAKPTFVRLSTRSVREPNGLCRRKNLH